MVAVLEGTHIASKVFAAVVERFPVGTVVVAEGTFVGAVCLAGAGYQTEVVEAAAVAAVLEGTHIALKVFAVAEGTLVVAACLAGVEC